VAARDVSIDTPWRAPVDYIAFPLIERMGEARAAKAFTPEFLESYRLIGRRGYGGVREQARGTYTLGKEGNRAAWIEARLAEIDDDLRQLESSQTMTAMRKRDELQREREQLQAERQQLRDNPRGADGATDGQTAPGGRSDPRPTFTPPPRRRGM
jgi:hypothetical protein